MELFDLNALQQSVLLLTSLEKELREARSSTHNQKGKRHAEESDSRTEVTRRVPETERIKKNKKGRQMTPIKETGWSLAFQMSEQSESKESLKRCRLLCRILGYSPGWPHYRADTGCGEEGLTHC